MLKARICGQISETGPWAQAAQDQWDAARRSIGDLWEKVLESTEDVLAPEPFDSYGRSGDSKSSSDPVTDGPLPLRPQDREFSQDEFSYSSTAEASSDWDPQGPASDAFCATMIVDDPGGVTLRMDDGLKAFQQCATLNVSRVDSGRLVCKVFVAERGQADDGILVESVLGLPLALLSTAQAAYDDGEGPPASDDQRLVYFYRSDATTGMLVRNHPYAIAERDPRWPGMTVVRRRRGVAKGQLQVRMDTQHSAASVVDVTGRLLASMERRAAVTIGEESISFHMAHGVDSCLMLCSMIACMKLSVDPTPGP